MEKSAKSCRIEKKLIVLPTHDLVKCRNKLYLAFKVDIAQAAFFVPGVMPKSNIILYRQTHFLGDRLRKCNYGFLIR